MEIRFNTPEELAERVAASVAIEWACAHESQDWESWLDWWGTVYDQLNGQINALIYFFRFENDEFKDFAAEIQFLRKIAFELRFDPPKDLPRRKDREAA